MLRRIATLVLLGLSLLAACKRKPATPPDVIARVGERQLTLADFKHYLDRNTGTDLAQLTPQVASTMLDQYLEEISVSEYAATRGIEIPADKVAAEVRIEAGATVVEKRDEMRREKLLADLTAELGEPAADQVQAYYLAHAAEFNVSEQVRVRQIIVRDEELANEIRKRLVAGETFGSLSAQYSRAPNAARGGEIGFVTREELPPIFADEIFRLQTGTVSNVIRTDSSFHIFQADERRPAGVVDLEGATPSIVVRLKEEALRARLAALVKSSRTQLPVAVLTRRLPFAYSGGLSKSVDE